MVVALRAGITEARIEMITTVTSQINPPTEQSYFKMSGRHTLHQALPASAP
jgi:hypothetical protein